MRDHSPGEGRNNPESREASRHAIGWFAAACFALAVCAMVVAGMQGVC